MSIIQLMYFCIVLVSASRLIRRELDAADMTGTVCINWFGNNLDWANIPFESMAPWGFTPEGCTEAIVEPYGEYSCATYDYSEDASPSIKMCNGDCFDGVCVNGYATTELPTTQQSTSVVTKSALLIIDVQNCFLPGGTLPVADGDAIIPTINNLRNSGFFDMIVLSQDWHPQNHVSFASNHDGKNAFDDITLEWTAEAVLCNSTMYGADSKLSCSEDEVAYSLQQTLWPDHCIQGTDDAEFSVDLETSDDDIIIQKGMDSTVDYYSAFYDNRDLFPTTLPGILEENGVTDVYVVGLALDYCVFHSSQSATELGYKTYVIQDATRGIAEDTMANAIQSMEATGVTMIESTDILATTQQPSVICSVGEAQDGTNCSPCNPGSYNDIVGGVCSPCPVGTYASDYGSATCTPCEIGSFASNEGTQYCEACSEGYTTDGLGQIECVAISTTSEPAVCSVGQAQHGDRCSPCQPGEYNENVGGVCSPCDVGTYASDFGSATCMPCPIGFFAPNAGSNICEVCPEGYTTDGFGQNECVEEATTTSEPTWESTTVPAPTVFVRRYEDISDQGLTVSYTIYNLNENCKLYYGVAEEGSPEPFVQDVVGGNLACPGSVAQTNGNLKLSLACSLTGGATYKFWVATDINGQGEGALLAHSSSSRTTFQIPVSCDDCAAAFLTAGGCEVLFASGDISSFIPSGCSTCGSTTRQLCIDESSNPSHAPTLMQTEISSRSPSVAPTRPPTFPEQAYPSFAPTSPQTGSPSKPPSSFPSYPPTTRPSAGSSVSTPSATPSMTPTFTQQANLNVIYQNTKLTCRNQGQKISQPCNGGRGTGCSYAACTQHCADEPACNFFFHIIPTNGCILYTSCNVTRKPAYRGTTVEMI